MEMNMFTWSFIILISHLGVGFLTLGIVRFIEKIMNWEHEPIFYKPYQEG